MTRLTRWGHACLRLDRDDSALVLDPGAFSPLETALDGVGAVLVTHEHADHVDVAAVAEAAGRGVDVWAPQPVLDALAAAGAPAERLHAVRGGDTFSAGGFDVRAVGERHATIHRDVPAPANVGYLVEGLLHPGDALVEGVQEPAVLAVPIGGPWVHVDEVVDWVRSVRPGRVVTIHDAHLSAAGEQLTTSLLERLAGVAPVRLAPGESIDL